MKFGGLFAGIGGIDLGLERAGMECVWQVEIDPYRRAVLARHWPDVKRYEDVRTVGLYDEADGQAGKCGRSEPKPNMSNPAIADGGNRQYATPRLDPVDLICGGFPCQDVSTAGKRAGLRAPRSGLFFEFARIIGELRPKWIVVENVPGLYSSNAGKDFDTVIGTLAELGYGLAWRVLDSQYFGVPQRRRRVFIVGYLGAPCPPAVLFEREGGEGNPAEGGKARQRVAYSLAASTRGTGDGHGNWWNSTYVAEENTRDELRIRGSHPHVSARWGGKQKPWIVNPLEAADGHHGRSSPRGDGADNLVVGPLIGGSGSGGIRRAAPGQGDEASYYVSSSANADGVRETTRLPRRLDSRRYAALGDAVTVNVAEWIGKRIMAVERCTS